MGDNKKKKDQHKIYKQVMTNTLRKSKPGKKMEHDFECYILKGWSWKSSLEEVVF